MWLKSLEQNWTDWWKKLYNNRVGHKASEELISSSRLKPRFFVMCLLSGLMATLGILLNDTVTLIAAMVLAPLLNPILAIAAGVVLGHKKLIWYATKSFFGGFFTIVVTTAVFIQWILWLGYEVEIDYFIQKFSAPETVFFLMLASFVTGFAAIYAWLRPTSNLNLVGIAIAASLVPFISFFGVLLGLQKFLILNDSAVLFGFNLLTLILGAVVAFLCLGFQENGNHITQEIAKAEKSKG
jgi:uncharacterized hydrophobic protein (TIGR00271 family)